MNKAKRVCFFRAAYVLGIIFATTASSQAATRQVGPGKTYSTPCAAVSAAAAGDIIEIDAGGNYAGNVCAINKNNLTLRGVGGRPKIDAAGKNYGGKGIWVVTGNDVTIENIEFSGARVPDRNGAAIRQEGTNVTIRNCYFHDNEMGILANANSASHIFIEKSEFAYNGTGDGYTHNLYVNQVKKLTLQYSYSHNSDLGQLVKSRAAETHVLYNRLVGGNSTTVYEVGTPNGGKVYIIGNSIHQSANTGNKSFIDYMLEGKYHADNQLFVINNTFVNDASSGTFVNMSSAATTPAIIKNNIFTGPGTISNQSSSVKANNYVGDAQFVNRSGYDYRLQSGSPAINAGIDPGTGGGMSLKPVFQYVHPACAEQRNTVSTIDIGAYEVGGSGSAVDCDGQTSPSATLYNVTIAPSSLIGGTTASGSATLDRPAPTGGAAIALSSSQTSRATVPASVTIPAGSTSANFTVSTSATTAPATANITASYAGVTKTATLTVNPPASSGLASLALSQSSVVGGNTLASNTVTLSANAPAGGAVVTLSSSNTSIARVPASVTVAAGARSATFSVTTSAVTAATTINLSAAYGGVTRSAGLIVNPSSTTPPPSTTSYSVWNNTTVPAVAADPDRDAVQLGMKFRSSKAGKVLGVRFYKGPGNSGTHVGSLWNRSGTRLATVTFTNETSSGWQTALFSTPVSITANTTYVVAYHAPVGRYAATTNFFSGKGATNAALSALASGVDGSNGVYMYGANNRFPSSTYQNTNYWVDIVFQEQ